MSLKNLMLAVSAVTFAAALAGPSNAATNLIDATYGAGAGSFELGLFTPRGPGLDNFQSLTGPSTTVTGWTVGGVGVDWLSSPDYAAHDGVHAIDLGYFDNGAGTITTSISTVIGATYSLSFLAAAVPGYPSYTNAGHVSAGSLWNQAFAPAFSDPHDFAHQVYEDYAFSFTALNSTTSISFSADTISTSYGPVIDQVSVSLLSSPGGVPEPATWALMILGFGAIGCVARRSRAAAKPGTHATFQWASCATNPQCNDAGSTSSASAPPSTTWMLGSSRWIQARASR